MTPETKNMGATPRIERLVEEHESASIHTDVVVKEMEWTGPHMSMWVSEPLPGFQYRIIYDGRGNEPYSWFVGGVWTPAPSLDAAKAAAQADYEAGIRSALAPVAPMKLHIDKEWLKRKIEEDGEEGEIGAGFEMFPLPAPVLDPNALEAARRAVGTIPGAALWTRVEEAIRAYLTALGTQPVPVAVTDAMVHAYKHSFGEYMDKSALGHITPPTPDVGFHATKYALGVALAPATQAAPMVEVPREPTEAMLNAVSGMSISGPYLGSNEARDIWDAMIAPVNQAVPDTTDEDKWTPEQHAAAISYLTGNPSR